MPPTLASCVFVAFVLWLFRRQTKQSGPLKSAWVPFVWVAINSSRSVAYWFSDGTTASQATDLSEGSFYDRNAYLLMMGIAFAILIQRRIDWNRIWHECRWITPYFAYCLIGALWAPDPFISFKRWIKACGDIVMILLLLTEANPVGAIRGVFVRCACLLIPVSVLFIKYYPDLGRYYHPWTWQTCYCGIAMGKNQLGQLAMLGGLFLLWQLVDSIKERGDWWRTLQKEWPEVLVFLMSVWLLQIAGSSTSVVCFVVGGVILVGARLPWVKTNLSNLGWCVLGFGLFMLLFTISADFRGVFATIVGRDATLTDRTLIWDMVLKSDSNPLIGEGYEGYWLSGLGNPVIEEFHVEYTHNAYLDQYLNGGIIGVLLFAIMLYGAGRNATSHFSRGASVGFLFLGLFWSCLLFNYTEIAFGRSNVFGLLLVMMAIFSPSFRSRNEGNLAVPAENSPTASSSLIPSAG